MWKRAERRLAADGRQVNDANKTLNYCINYAHIHTHTKWYHIIDEMWIWIINSIESYKCSCSRRKIIIFLFSFWHRHFIDFFFHLKFWYRFLYAFVMKNKNETSFFSLFQRTLYNDNIQNISAALLFYCFVNVIEFFSIMS